mmetsp:Transcript_34988/g.29495  ORF Transcript_34988/g.29495 Transcript_34988/m.29495 type:complete len:215 (-) Transcript_34988:1049-1693(-)
MDSELKIKVCNIFIKFFEDDQTSSSNTSSNKMNSMIIKNKEQIRNLEVESILSVFNLVKELNVKEYQFKLMNLLETHVMSLNEHILDPIFTKIFIESLIQCWYLSVDKTRNSLHTFIASMINKLIFYSDAFKRVVIDSLFQLKQITEIEQLIDSLLQKVIVNENDSHLQSYVQAKLNLKKEDTSYDTQNLDIDILDKIINDDTIDLNTADIGKI